MTSNTPVIPARMACDQLKALAAKHSLSINITWTWCERVRYGVLHLVDSAGSAVISVTYARSTQLWGRGDESLDLVRTGSNKHHAILSGKELLEAHVAKTAAVATCSRPAVARPAPTVRKVWYDTRPMRLLPSGRQPGGMSDLLID